MEMKERGKGMTTILGIDQGSSQTRGVLCDEKGRLLALEHAAGACHAYDGMERAMAAVFSVAEAVLDQAGLLPKDLSLVYGGFTGADWPDEYLLLQKVVSELGLCPMVHITNDSIIALRAGTRQPYGAILIAGSGGNCAIRTPDGQQFIYHYYHDSDLQGGDALGHQALRKVYRAATFREPSTLLTQRILDFYQLTTVDGLLRAQVEGRLSPKSIRQLAPIIFQAALEGDAVASDILRHFGEGMAELVTAGLRHYCMLEIEVDVVLSGSIFKGVGPLLVDTITRAVHTVARRANLVNAHYEPVVGAALLGLEVMKIPIDVEVQENIERTAAALGLIRH